MTNKEAISNTLMTTGQFKAPLSLSIQKEYNKLRLLISEIPSHARAVKNIEGTGGMVSVADIIAYQIGWGKLLIDWYTAGLQGKMPEMPGEGFKKWNYTALAQLFYDKYHYDGDQKQDRQLYELVCQILAIVEHEYGTGNLDKIGVWPWCRLSSGKEWPLSKWITVNTASPYKKATALLRKFLKNQKQK